MTDSPAGWYADPWTPSAIRYWDGRGWTPHQRFPSATTAITELRAPAGTGWNTVWIWLVVLLPVAPALLLLFVPWGSMFDVDLRYIDDAQALTRTMLGPLLSPVLWVVLPLSWISFAATAYSAYRDQRQLETMGVPRPFPWPWVFLNPVYPIGRSVVVRRRTGRGLAPLWAAIGVLVLTQVVALVMIAEMTIGMLGFFQQLMLYTSR